MACMICVGRNGEEPSGQLPVIELTAPPPPRESDNKD